jgi:hypothetical protein
MALRSFEFDLSLPLIPANSGTLAASIHFLIPNALLSVWTPSNEGKLGTSLFLPCCVVMLLQQCGLVLVDT